MMLSQQSCFNCVYELYTEKTIGCTDRTDIEQCEPRLISTHNIYVFDHVQVQ